MLNEAPKRKKEQKPEDRIYNPKLDLNACLAQAFQNLKEEKNQHGWNVLVEELKGVTMRRQGTDQFSVSYHKYFTGSPQDADTYEREANKFLDGVLKELKKHFKKLSGKVLEVKKLDENRTVDKYGRLTADHQSLYGGTVYGGIIGKFLLTYNRIYHIEAPNPQTGSPEKGPAVWG